MLFGHISVRFIHTGVCVDWHLVSKNLSSFNFSRERRKKSVCVHDTNFFFLLSIELLAFDLMKTSNLIRYARIMYLKLIC